MVMNVKVSPISEINAWKYHVKLEKNEVGNPQVPDTSDWREIYGSMIKAVLNMFAYGMEDIEEGKRSDSVANQFLPTQWFLPL